MKKTLYFIQLNEFVHDSVTTYRKQSKQNIPNYAGTITTRVNISHLNTSLNYRSTLHYTTLNYIAQLSFISNFIPALLFSFASFLFLLSNLRHNFDSVLPACYKRLIFLWFHTTFIWIMVQWIPIQPFFSQQ